MKSQIFEIIVGIFLVAGWMLAVVAAILFKRNRRLVDELRESEKNLEEKVLTRTKELSSLFEKVELAKKEWEMTFDSLNELIYMHDRDFRIVRCNIAFMEYVGLEPKDIIGREYFTLFPRSEGPLDICRKAIEKRLEYAEEFIDLEKGRVFLIGYYPIFNKEGEHIYSIHSAMDITERKKSELMIKEEAEVSKSLLKIFEVINTSLEEEELINSVVSIAPHYLKFDRIAVFLYDEEMKGYVLLKVHGLSQSETEILMTYIPRKEDITFIELARTGKPLIINDESCSDLLPPDVVSRLQIKNVVIAPVMLKDKMTGFIYGDYKTVRPIEQREVSLIKGLADGLGIALQNSRLYKELTERMMELSKKMEIIETMHQIDRNILSKLDKRDIFDSAVEMVNRVIPCDRATVLLVDGDVFNVLAEWGIGSLKRVSYSKNISHLNQIIENRNYLLIPDLTADNVPCAYHEELKTLGIRSSLTIPLISKDMIIGLFDLGSIDPDRFNPEHISTAYSIADQITVSIENVRLYEDLEDLLFSTIQSLASAIDAKSPWTKGHSERVTNYALEIGRKMDLDEKSLETLKLGGLLHDIGKIGTYDVVLDKPDKLTDEEFELVKKHPGRGAEILGPIKQLRDVIPVIKYHHERIDGRGYPEGLKGEDIPLLTKILCVADSFDSMTADRPYRPARDREFAINELRRCSGSQFDSEVVDAFLKVLKEK